MTKSINFPDAKRAFHNSRRVWPTDRQHMADANLITTRMAEDATVLIRERGADAVVTVEDLLEQGWTFDQVRRFGDAAMALIPAGEGDHANAA